MHQKNIITLSIITVTKNCGKTLQRTIDSVSSVKTPCVEYVVVDGLSVDNTHAVIESNIATIDKYISEPDSGIYNAMNKGVSVASGRYLMFLNGDDQIVQDGFFRALDEIKNSSSIFYCGSCIVISEAGNVETILRSNPSGLPWGNSIPHPSAFVSREYILKNPYREDFKIASDYYLFLYGYISNEKFEITSEIISKHHRGGASRDAYVSTLEVEQIRHELVPIRFYARKMKQRLLSLI